MPRIQENGHEKLYQAAGGAQGFDPNQAGGPNPGNPGQGGGQDYYDADYTVVDDDK